MDLGEIFLENNISKIRKDGRVYRVIKIDDENIVCKRKCNSGVIFLLPREQEVVEIKNRDIILKWEVIKNES